MEMTIDEAVRSIAELDKAYRSFSDNEYQALNVAAETMRKYQQLEDFAKWVAKEVIDEDMWEYNHLSFAEIACRKLVRLGIMQESDGEYTYEVVEDGQNTIKD